jgi:hypothetical protein
MENETSILHSQFSILLPPSAFFISHSQFFGAWDPVGQVKTLWTHHTWPTG